MNLKPSILETSKIIDTIDYIRAFSIIVFMIAVGGFGVSIFAMFGLDETGLLVGFIIGAGVGYFFRGFCTLPLDYMGRMLLIQEEVLANTKRQTEIFNKLTNKKQATVQSNQDEAES